MARDRDRSPSPARSIASSVSTKSNTSAMGRLRSLRRSLSPRRDDRPARGASEPASPDKASRLRDRPVAGRTAAASSGGSPRGRSEDRPPPARRSGARQGSFGRAADTSPRARKSVSPKPPARQVKLTASEAAMAGAPSGPIYHVEVKPSSALAALPNPSSELSALMRRDLQGNTKMSPPFDAHSWDSTFEAVDSLRRLAVYHTSLLATHKQALGLAVPFLCAACRSPRSAVARSSLLCARDLIAAGLGGVLKKRGLVGMLVQTLVEVRRCLPCGGALVERSFVSEAMWPSGSSLTPPAPPRPHRSRPTRASFSPPSPRVPRARSSSRSPTGA